MFVKPIHLLCLGTLLVPFLGCDAFEQEEAPEYAHIYFPAKLGTRWTYDYSDLHTSDFNGSYSSSQGTLTWTVVDSMGGSGIVRLTIREDFNGIRRYRHIGIADMEEEPSQWSRTFVAVLGDSTLDLSDYSEYMPSLLWRSRSPLADTFAVDTLLHAGFGVVARTSVTLVSGEGLVHWYGGTSGRWDDNYALSARDEIAADVRNPLGRSGEQGLPPEP